jgi:hypothetical protein
MLVRSISIALLGVLATVSVAQAEPSAQQQKRARVFASLPDWTGIWEAEAWSKRTAAGRPAGGIEEVRSKSVLMGHPPYNAKWEAVYQKGVQNLPALMASEMGRKNCAFTFPADMESPSVFQVAITPEEVLIVFVLPYVRHIYTDGRGHPPKDDLWPTSMGDSIGHWEGDTLVVETIARAPDAGIAIASPISKVSEQARFIERIRLVSKDVLENQMTIEDPEALAKPWTVTLRYHRVTDMPRMLHYDCTENDRNPIVNGELTIAPPSP